MADTLIQYFSYDFVRYALIVGVLISLCASLLGVTLVLKRYSFIGDGLSHVAFGAMAVATLFSRVEKTYIIMPVTIIAAVLLLRAGQNAKVKGDAAIAMLSVGALALGYIIMNVFSTSANVSGDVCSTLFGSTSLLTLKADDVIMTAVFSLIVLVLFIVFYHRIFAVTFDESFAKATGINVSAYQTLIAVIIAIVIVIGMDLVGSLLISALVIFPALAAMSVIKSFKGVVVFSAVIAVTCAVLGMFISILAKTPVGATIVATDIAAYIICSVAGRIKK
jgi:zinc transport system permease protein